MKAILVLAAGTVLGTLAGPVAAMTPRGAAAAAAAAQLQASARAAPPPARAASVANALTLIAGQVTAVDRARRMLTIGGRQVEWHDSKLQVFFSHGGRASPASLQPGTRVRFALEPGSGEGGRIVLVYVEREP